MVGHAGMSNMNQDTANLAALGLVNLVDMCDVHMMNLDLIEPAASGDFNTASGWYGLCG